MQAELRTCQTNSAWIQLQEPYTTESHQKGTILRLYRTSRIRLPGCVNRVWTMAHMVCAPPFLRGSGRKHSMDPPNLPLPSIHDLPCCKLLICVPTWRYIRTLHSKRLLMYTVKWILRTMNKQMCKCACQPAYIHMYIHTHVHVIHVMHTRVVANIHTRTYMHHIPYIHTYVHTYIPNYIYIYTWGSIYG